MGCKGDIIFLYKGLGRNRRVKFVCVRDNFIICNIVLDYLQSYLIELGVCVCELN